MANTFNHNDKVVITDGGSVGIGKTSSISAPLNVFSASTTNIAIFENNANSIAVKIGDSSNSNYANLVLTSNSGNAQIWKAGSAYTSWGGTKSLNIYNSNGAIAFHPNNTANAMFINTSGNVGIGTTSPSYKFEIGAVGSDVISAKLTQGYERVRFNSFDLLGYTDGHLWMIGNNNPSIVLGSSWNWDTQVEFAYFPGTVGAAGGELQIGQTNKNSTNWTHGITTFITNGSERMRINASGNVGIGTTSPVTKLNLKESNTGTEGFIITNWNNVNTLLLGSDSSTGGGKITLKTNSGTSNVFISSYGVSYLNGGNVGIGTTSPGYKLHVKDSTNVGTIAIGHDSYPGLLYSNAGTGEFRIDNRASAGAGYITFYPNGQAGTVGSEAMRITPSGNVGIGTTSPESLFHVQASNGTIGVIKIEGGNSVVTASGEVNSRLDFGSNDPSVNSSGNVGSRIASVTENTNGAIVGLAFSTFYQSRTPDDLAEAMRISGSGNVGIGTTSPAYKLTVAGRVSVQNDILHVTAASPTLLFSVPGGGIDSKIYNDGSGNFIIGHGSNSDNPPEKFRIDSSGNVGIGTTSPSDKLHVAGSVKITTGDVNLDAGRAITFYGNSNTNHSISSTNNTGGSADDIRINSYGAIYFNLDSNSNNTSGADFKIARHGGTSTLSDYLFTLSGETGNVGIGETNVDARLHITTASAGLVNQKFESVGSAAWRLGIPASQTYFAFDNSADALTSPKMVINSSGNVGIGTTSPGYKLDVSGGAIAIRGNAAGNSLRFDDSAGTSRNAMYVDTSNYLNIGNSNYAGVKFVQTASAPSTGGFSGESIAEAFGSTENGKILAEPSAWLAVRVGTTDYAIPMYTTG